MGVASFSAVARALPGARCSHSERVWNFGRTCNGMSHSMRVLLINYELPPIGAGAGNATAHIARYLAATGVHVRVLTSQFRGLPVRECRDGYEIWRAPSIRERIDRC